MIDHKYSENIPIKNPIDLSLINACRKLIHYLNSMRYAL